MRTYRGWTVDYEKPWWHAEKDAYKPGETPLSAATLAGLKKMIDRRTTREQP